MEVVDQSPVENREDLRLLLAWEHGQDRSREQRAGALSIAAHIVAVCLLLLMPRETFHPKPAARHFTALIVPPKDLTQTTPNRGKISKEFNVESLKPRDRIQSPPSAPSISRPRAPNLSRPAPKPTMATLPEPPKIEVAQNTGPKLPQQGIPQAPPPPQIQPEEKPKLAFETPGGSETGKGAGLGKIAPPNTSVTEAVRSLSHGGGGGMMVGDIGAGISGIGDTINQTPTPGKRGSSLELLSDPMGVDFRPYLLQILSTVRRNWFAVWPESARLGRAGKVAVQFAIARNGSVTKVVFGTVSGTEALDRAAVASISMSNPFPPLPTEFRGNVVRLQFTYLYNIPAR